MNAERVWKYLSGSIKPSFWLYAATAIAVSLQQWFSYPKNFGHDIFYPDYNNFIIFRQSFFHLIDGKDLYQPYLLEHWDLYKYSPTFSLLIAPLAILPDLAGVILWTLLNALIILWSVQRLPHFDQEAKVKILLFVLIELVTSLQNMQSNALMAGLLILAFALLEEGKYIGGIVCITLTVYIKVFGILAFGLLLFYPNKPRLILYSAMSMVTLFLLPLVVISFQQLLDLYVSWWRLLSSDHSAAFGLSMMGWLRTWFGIVINKDWLVLLGLILLGLPLLWWKRYSMIRYRLLLFASLLVWLVIFNHMAESPTFIIAACGAALWYFSAKRGTLDLSLMILFFVFTILSRTDLFPSAVQENWFQPYVVKAVPAILIWFRMVSESLLWQES